MYIKHDSKKLLITACFVLLIIACAGDELDMSNVKMSNAPLYQDVPFVTIENRFTIDFKDIDEYQIRDISDFAVDDNMNLYALDYYESKVNVFSNDGRFLRCMGQPGEGPSDLNRPKTIEISGNNLYIYENFQGFKVWDLDGNYQDYIVRKGRGNNRMAFKPFDDFFFTHSYSQFRNSNKWTWTFGKYSWDWDLQQTIDVTEMNYMEEPNYYQFAVIAVDSERNVYLPVTRDLYIINKYDADGNLLFQFGREFERKPYAQWLRDWNSKEFKEEIKRNEMPLLPKYPPYIRHIMVDEENNYIWVFVGEGYYDTYFRVKQPVTIDIFNTNGAFIYTFNTDKMGRQPQIHKGQLYTKGIIGEDKLHVYNHECPV